MGILDYTTKVPVSRTIAQIQAKLVEHGARAVMMEYGDDGRVKALAFNIKMPNRELPIRLPINTASTLRVLQRQVADREISAGYAKDDHAYRVAWHWLSAQMALLETEMVQFEEIFLPYVITDDGRTLFKRLEERQFLLGPGGQT